MSKKRLFDVQDWSGDLPGYSNRTVAVGEIWKDSAGNICYYRDNGTLSVGIDFSDDPGLTEQNHLDETNLSTIVGRYARSGIPITIPEQQLVDLTNLPDYQDSLNAVHLVDKLFASLPIEVKQAYDQNPSLLMKALSDPSQKQRLIDLGVLDAPKAPLDGNTLPSSGTGVPAGDIGST